MTLNSRCQAIGYVLCIHCLLDTISKACYGWERIRLDTVITSIIRNSVCYFPCMALQILEFKSKNNSNRVIVLPQWHSVPLSTEQSRICPPTTPFLIRLETNSNQSKPSLWCISANTQNDNKTIRHFVLENDNKRSGGNEGSTFASQSNGLETSASNGWVHYARVLYSTEAWVRRSDSAVAPIYGSALA